MEGLGNSLSTVITFYLFLQGFLVNSLGIMQQFGVQIIFVILVATLALLATTGWTGAFYVHMKDARKEKNPPQQRKRKERFAHESVCWHYYFISCIWHRYLVV